MDSKIWSRSAGRVLYVVEDDGPGVAAEEREAIFEPGVRSLNLANAVSIVLYEALRQSGRLSA